MSVGLSRTVSEIFSVNNGVTLKPGIGVVQGHCKWRRSIDHIRLPIGPTLYNSYLVPFLSYLKLNILTLKSGLEVTQDHSNRYYRKLGCGFLFAFHSNYGSILQHFRDKTRLSKIMIFHIPLAFDAVVRGVPV